LNGSFVFPDDGIYGLNKHLQKTLIIVITFSGDKLLGGPQAGIIVGNKEYIEKMKTNNLLRTLRVSKLTLAALEITLREYLDETQAIKNIPTLKMILEGKDKVKIRADFLYEKLSKIDGLEVEKVETKAMIGGGSMPTEVMDSYGVSISSKKYSVTKLENNLRCGTLSIISRIQNERVVFDCKTLNNSDIDDIYEILNKELI